MTKYFKIQPSIPSTAHVLYVGSIKQRALAVDTKAYAVDNSVAFAWACALQQCSWMSN